MNDPTPFGQSHATRPPYRTRLRHALEDLSIWLIKRAVGTLVLLALVIWLAFDYVQTRTLTRDIARQITTGGLLQILAQQQQELVKQQTQRAAPMPPAVAPKR